MNSNLSTQRCGTAETVEEALYHSGLLNELPAELRERLVGLGTMETLSRGHHLITQGQLENRLIVVLSGTLVVSRHRYGNRAQLGILRKGETIGAMHLIDPHPASADVVAVDGAATVWSVPDSEIHALIASDPAIGFSIVKAVAKQICRRTRQDRNNLWKHLEASQAYFRNMDL